MIVNYIYVVSTMSDENTTGLLVNSPMEDVYLMLCKQILANVPIQMLLDITPAIMNETTAAPLARCGQRMLPVEAVMGHRQSQGPYN